MALAFGSEDLAPETTRLRRGVYGFGAARKASEPFGHHKWYWRGRRQAHFIPGPPPTLIQDKTCNLGIWDFGLSPQGTVSASCFDSEQRMQETTLPSARAKSSAQSMHLMKYWKAGLQDGLQRAVQIFSGSCKSHRMNQCLNDSHVFC